MTQSLKVPVSTLIANAEKRREAIIAEHQKSLIAFKDDSGTVRERLLDALMEEYDRLATARRLPQAYSRWRNGKFVNEVTASVTIATQIKPDPKPDTSDVDRDIALLKATSQDTISVRVDGNFAAYL